MDFSLDSNGDIYLDENGNEAIVHDEQHTLQHINQRIRFFQDDYFLARDVGIPWVQGVYNGMSIETIEAIIKTEILNTPLVIRFEYFKTFMKNTILFVQFCVFIETPKGEVKLCNDMEF